jgi:hypothetical protein
VRWTLAAVVGDARRHFRITSGTGRDIDHFLAGFRGKPLGMGAFAGACPAEE